MKRLALLISIMCAMQIGHAQELSRNEAKDVLKKIASNYVINHYSLKYTKKMYRSVEEKEPMETGLGTLRIGEKNQFRLEEPGVLVVQNNELNLTVDSTNQMVFISKVDPDFLPIQIANWKDDSLMNDFKFSFLREGTQLTFKVEHRQELSNSILMELDPKTYWVLRFTYYMPAGNYFSETMDDETIESPYLVIEYEKPLKEKQASGYFSMQQWLPSLEVPLTLNPAMKGFTLHDTRVESHL